MPTIYTGTVSLNLGNTKNTRTKESRIWVDYHGQTTAQRIREKIYSILEYVQENLDVTNFKKKLKPTYSKVLEPTSNCRLLGSDILSKFPEKYTLHLHFCNENISLSLERSSNRLYLEILFPGFNQDAPVNPEFLINLRTVGLNQEPKNNVYRESSVSKTDKFAAGKKKFLEPRHGDSMSFIEKQICHGKSQIKDVLLVQEGGYLKRFVGIIHLHLIRLLNYSNRSTELPIKGFRAYPGLRVDKLSIGYGKQDTSQTQSCSRVNNYNDDCSSVDNSFTNPVAGELPHVKGETKDERNRIGVLKNKGIAVICFLLMIGSGGGASSSNGVCLGVLKNKGIAVMCFLLMIRSGGGALSSNGVCSDSKDLEVITSGPLKVGNDMKLICRHKCSNGTPKWDKDKPVGRMLTYNGYVLLQYLQKITLDNQSNEYNIIVKNVTFTDINSTYTCHYGYAFKQIRPIEDYKVLPTIESISKQSVYKNNVLNGTLEFKKVYPLPECVLYCDDKRQKKIPTCETCKTWERDFFKVKFTFNIDLNNKNCREENVSVRCAVGRENYKYDFSKLPKTKENNEETAGILIGVIIGVLVGFAVLGTILYKLYKHGAFRRYPRGQ